MAENALKAGHRVLATARNPMKAAQDYPQIESLGKMASIGYDKQANQRASRTSHPGERWQN